MFMVSLFHHPFNFSLLSTATSAYLVVSPSFLRHRKKYEGHDELRDHLALVMIRFPMRPYSTLVPLLSFWEVPC